MCSNDIGDDPHIHNRVTSIPLDTFPEPQLGHDIYSSFFSDHSMIAGINLAIPPYSSSVGGPVDMSMSLQQTLMQQDTSDSHDLPESYALVQRLPEQQRPPSPPLQPQQNNVPFLPSTGHTHTMLPSMIQPNPSDSSIQFNSETLAFNQRITNAGTSQTDPYASSFLRAQLGPIKFNIFSARLSERRVGAQPSIMRIRAPFPSLYSDQKTAGVTAIDFLVKVEVVKEILRTYVPHPYNPLKSLTHLFEGSPKGSVTLSRSTVLILSGWSNTQFSYWARRAEAISVLGQYDERLLSVGMALRRRLRGAITDPPEVPVDAQSITGKGLDVIIDDVKKRTGVSQFLRGKHSSLDPFGSACMDGKFGVGDNVGAETGEGMQPATKTTVFSATFQAVAYEHSSPPPVHPPFGVLQQKRGRGKRRSGKDGAVQDSGRTVGGKGYGEEAQKIALISDKHGILSDQPATPSSIVTSTTGSTKLPSTCSGSRVSDREHRSMGTTTVDDRDNPNEGVQIPVSDSRSELEPEEGLRKRKLVNGKATGGKRMRG